MSLETRRERMADDFAALQVLQQVSSILEFDAEGSPPDHYNLRFRGKGLARDISPHSQAQLVTLHEIEIRLPYSYPRKPPDIRWMSPILHPNVSYSGFVSLRDLGLPWTRDVGLDVVCERLWDVARLAFVDTEHATNYAAKNWLEQDCQWALPVDHRPLRDRASQAGHNVVRYQRKGRQPAEFSAETVDNDILFIGEDTPIPDEGLPGGAHRAHPTGRDDDILYIGYD